MGTALLIILALLLVGGGYAFWSARQWEVFPAAAKGLRVKGDPDVPPTKGFLKHAYLRLFVWKTVAVLEVPEAAARRGYQVGFIPFDGPAKCHAKVYHDQSFAMLVGHEDPVFFAIDVNGKEVELTLLARTRKDNSLYRHIPLH